MRSYSMLAKNKIPSILTKDENKQAMLKAYAFYINAMVDQTKEETPMPSIASSTFTRVKDDIWVWYSVITAIHFLMPSVEEAKEEEFEPFPDDPPLHAPW